MQRFIDDIEALVSETVDMGNLASEMIEKSVQAIVDGNVELADEVIDDFARIDRYDNEIEEAAIRILTIYQPTAVDTRTVATILKSITYLERIGKYSYNIATATKYLSDKPMFEPVHLIQPFGEVAVRMVKLVTKAFEEKSADGLDKISEMDDYLARWPRRSTSWSPGCAPASSEIPGNHFKPFPTPFQKGYYVGKMQQMRFRAPGRDDVLSDLREPSD